MKRAVGILVAAIIVVCILASVYCIGGICYNGYQCHKWQNRFDEAIKTNDFGAAQHCLDMSSSYLDGALPYLIWLFVCVVAAKIISTILDYFPVIELPGES